MENNGLFWANVFWLVLVAACLGSFANVLIYRLPVMLFGQTAQHGANTFNLALPASFCPTCLHPIRSWHNIPLLSFILLRARCAYCQSPIAQRYFWVELGVVVWALLCVLGFGLTWQALAYFVFLYVLWVASWIDGLHFLLPDVLNAVLLVAGLIAAVAFAKTGVVNALMDALAGAAMGFMLLWLPYIAYLKWRHIEGLGLGDCKLLAAIGCWFGAAAMPRVLLSACVLALVFGCSIALLRGHPVRSLKIPFGPFISAGALIQLWLLSGYAPLWLSFMF